MKFSKRVLAPIVMLAMLFFSSCQKDDSFNSLLDFNLDTELSLDTEGVDVYVGDLEAENFVEDLGIRGGSCLELVFPVTLIFPDSSEVEVSDRAEAKAAIMQWIEDNGRRAGKPTLQFPFSVITQDGSTVDVGSKDELLALRKDCLRKDKRKQLRKCLTLVYPVVIEFPDATILKVSSKVELKMALIEWKKANRGVADHPKLQLPFFVVNKGGDEFEINSKDDLIAARKSCK